jgi:putative flippase GtrA
LRIPWFYLKFHVKKILTLKFIAVSAMNFLVGYLIFFLIWLALQDHLGYLPIATLATSLAAIWSFQSHNRVTLNRRSVKSFVSLQYLSFQIIALVLSSITVPMASEFLEVNLLIIQLFWAFFLSVLGLIVLINYSN